jgi:type I restriction enzyme, S subunit
MNSAWQTKRIGDLGRIVTGKTPSSSKPECFGCEYPFVTPTDMHERRYATQTDRYLSEEGAMAQRTLLVPAGSVSVSCIGWQMGKAIVTTRSSFTNQQLHTIIPLPHMDTLFLYYSLTTRREEFLSLGSAAGVRTPIINKSAFCDLLLPIPPFPLQRKIAAILSAYDDLIENNARRIAILEAMAQAIYREWFVEFRFPGYKKVKRVDSPLGRIPAGWSVMKVEEVVKRLSAGKKYDQKTVEPSGEVPVLDQGKSGIIGYHNDVPGVDASFQNPVIVFANHTCYQRMILFPFSAIQNVLPFIPSVEHYRNIYWLHWATKDLVAFNDYKGHWPELVAKTLLVPQAGLCEDFGCNVRPMVLSTHALHKKNANLRKTRDLLLPKLISGQLDIEDLDIETGETVTTTE